MDKFEYLRISLHRDSGERNFSVLTVATTANDSLLYDSLEDREDADSRVDINNELGDLGWELVSMCPLEIELGNGYWFIAEKEQIYKRKKN